MSDTVAAACAALAPIFRGSARRPVEELARLDPAFMERAAALYADPASATLPSRERALLEVALDAMVTQLDPVRLRESLRLALAEGATAEEITAVLEVVAVIGLHAATVGLPILFDAHPVGDRPLTEHEAALAAEMESDHPRPHRITPLYAALLRFDADYLARFVGVIDHPWSAGVLTPRFIHLVCILIDVACTHLYEPGLRLHIEQALEHGATADEVLEVVRVASATGLRTIELGFEALLDALDEGEGPATT